jgi:hypothetical protein
MVNFVGHPDQIMLTSTYYNWCDSIGVGFSLIPLFGSFDGIVFNTIADYPKPLRDIIEKYSINNLSDHNKFSGGNRVASS